MTRAMYRGYPASSSPRKSARVTRLHIIREEGPNGWPQTWCGQSAGVHRNSQPVIIDPMPLRAPEGLSWCPKCIGHLAERYWLLDEIAESLAAFDPGLYPDVEARWARRRAQVAAGQMTTAPPAR